MNRGDTDALALGLRVPAARRAGFSWLDYPDIEVRYDATRLGNLATKTGAAIASDSEQKLSIDSAAITAYDLTMCCWFKSTTNASQCLMFVGEKGDTDEYQSLEITGTTVLARSESAASSGAQANNTAIDPDDGDWHFAAAAISASDRAAYADATVSSDSTTVTIGATYDRTSIGCRNLNTPANYFDGTIDNAAIFSVKLTSPQITWLYNSGTPRTYNELATSTDTNNPGTTNLVAFWRLDETNGVRVDQHGSFPLTPAGTAVAISFASASNEYASTSTAAAIGTAISMGCSLKSGTTAKQIAVWLGDKDADDVYMRIGLDAAGNGMLSRSASGGSEDITSGANIDDDAWHFVAGVTTASNDVDLYVDDNAAVNDTTSVTLANFDTTAIGAHAGSTPGTYMDGEVDNVWIYQETLTAANITFLRTGGRGGGRATYQDVVQSSHPDNPGVTNLQAWYQLNEQSGSTLVNVHDGTHNLTTQNTPTLGVAGDVIDLPYPTSGASEETALVEDRAIETSEPKSWHMTSSSAPALSAWPRSLVCWLRTTSTTFSYPFAIGNTTDDQQTLALLAGGGIRYYVRSGGGTQVLLDSVATVNDGEWHLVVAKSTADNAHALSIDGAAFTTSSTDTGGLPGTQHITIGGRAQSSPIQELDGFVDECMVFDAELTAADASDLWNDGAGVTARDIVDGVVTLDSGATPVAAYPCSANESGSNPQGKDITGNGYNLTPANSPPDAFGIAAGQALDGHIYRLIDVGATSYDAVNEDYIKRPQMIRVSDGAGYALWFDGVNDFLQTANFAADMDQPNDLFCVFAMRVTDQLMHYTDGRGTKQHAMRTVSSTWRLYAGSDFNSGVATDTNLHVQLGHFNSTSSNSYMDGSPATPGDAFTQPLGAVTIGANFNGAAAAAVTFRQYLANDGTLTTDERNEIGNKYADEHGTTWTEIT